MIATILSSSKSFNAVNYNERKVAAGDAELLEISNFGYIETLNLHDRESYIRFLKEYSQANRSDLKNAQFHAAISCKGQEWSKEQLLEFAHSYLTEMGYAGQPTLIYFHHDTDNNHLHIVTSRVKDGKKIDNNHERIRSQKIIDKLLGLNQKEETKQAISQALEYRYQNINQFMVILESQGYQCKKSSDALQLYKGGALAGTVDFSDIENHANGYTVVPKRLRQIAAWLDKYKNTCRNKEELSDLMKKKFGVVLMFHGKEFSPYGYTIIDHAQKSVYKGSLVYPLKSLLHYTLKDNEDANDVKNASKKQYSKTIHRPVHQNGYSSSPSSPTPSSSSSKYRNLVGTILGAKGYTAVGRGGDDPRKKKRFDDDEELNQENRGRGL